MVPAADTKGSTMENLSTAPFRAAKKTERKVSKGKGKETDPGYFGNPLRSARACLRVKRPKPTCSYEFAGAAADEVAKIVWGTTQDFLARLPEAWRKVKIELDVSGINADGPDEE